MAHSLGLVRSDDPIRARQDAVGRCAAIKEAR